MVALGALQRDRAVDQLSAVSGFPHPRRPVPERGVRARARIDRPAPGRAPRPGWPTPRPGPYRQVPGRFSSGHEQCGFDPRGPVSTPSGVVQCRLAFVSQNCAPFRSPPHSAASCIRCIVRAMPAWSPWDACASRASSSRVRAARPSPTSSEKWPARQPMDPRKPGSTRRRRGQPARQPGPAFHVAAAHVPECVRGDGQPRSQFSFAPPSRPAQRRPRS